MQWERRRAEVGMGCGLLLYLVLFRHKLSQLLILVKKGRSLRGTR